MLQPSIQFSGSYYRTPVTKELPYRDRQYIDGMDQAAQILREDIARELGPDIQLSFSPENALRTIVIEKAENGVFKPLTVWNDDDSRFAAYVSLTDQDTKNPVAFLKQVIAKAKVLEQKEQKATQEKAMIDAVQSELSGQVAPRVECSINFAYANGLAETRNIIEAFSKANLDARLPEGIVFVLGKHSYHDNKLEVKICKRSPDGDAAQNPLLPTSKGTLGNDENTVLRASRYTKLLANILPTSLLNRFKGLETEESVSEFIDRAVKRAHVLVQLEKDAATFEADYKTAKKSPLNKFEMKDLNFISAFGLQASLERLKGLEASMPALNAIHPDLHLDYSVDGYSNMSPEHIFIGLGGSNDYHPVVLGLDHLADWEASFVYRKRNESFDQFLQRTLNQAKALIQEKTKREVELSQSRVAEAYTVS